MKTQKGSALGIILGVLGLLFLVVALIAAIFFHYKDRGSDFQVKIGSSYRLAQSSLSKYTLKMQDLKGLKNMDTQALKDLLTSSNTSRYGADGSQAAVQWLKENNIPVNNELVTKMAVLIDSGRDEYGVQQENLNADCTTFKYELGRSWSGLWYSIAGRPDESNKKEFSLSMCDLVLDAATVEAYETKQAKSVF
jgi:hypothetical protein